MSFDVVIVSNGTKNEHRRLTETAISTCGDHNIVVVEKTKIDYGVKTIRQPEHFNYNECLNMGASLGSNEIIVFCNNDLIFYDGWEVGIRAGIDLGYGSLSPYCPRHHAGLFPKGWHIYDGYRVRYELVGWCIACSRGAWERIGRLDESVDFWFSDNLYADQLQYYGVKHGLVCSSFVEHKESATLKTARNKKQITYGQRTKYEEARGKYAKGKDSA